MKKVLIIILLTLFGLTAFSSIKADYDDMMGSGMGSWMMGGGGWMGFAGLTWFLLASFVFSLIFWLVYKWLIKK